MVFSHVAKICSKGCSRNNIYFQSVHARRSKNLLCTSSSWHYNDNNNNVALISKKKCQTKLKGNISPTISYISGTGISNMFDDKCIHQKRRSIHASAIRLQNLSDMNNNNNAEEVSDNVKEKEEPLTLLEKFQTQQKDEYLTVSILGPSNAGKSTLFNRLMCKESNKAYRLSSEKSSRRPNRSKARLGNNHPSRQNGGAIVSATPGTTRDRRECVGRIGGTFFSLIDTAGVDKERINLLARKIATSGYDDLPLETKMIQQTLEAAKQSDLIFLMFDARLGLTADFADIVKWLRKIENDPIKSSLMKREVIILANKLEGDAWANYYSDESMVYDHLAEVSRLGFGEAIAISAEHGEGMADIGRVIDELSRTKRQLYGFEEPEEEIIDRKSNSNDKREKPLRLAVLGRQNVGKSTLINSLLKEDRVIVGSTPGLTRDAIAVNWSWMGRPVQLVDTAGIRKMSKRDHSNDIEDLSVRDAMRAMKIADVAVLVLDAEARMLQRQELAIADAVIREGRALVVAANKMDLLVDHEYTKEQYASAVREQIEHIFPMLRSTPIVSMSSLSGEAVEDLMPVVFNARDRWSRVINTGLLNRWLADVVEGQQPPLVQGRSVRIKYIMQVKGRPPTFILFCNVDKLPVSYLRYLTRNFQHTFEMFGMEVRLAVKKSAPENPFHDKSKNKGGIGIGGAEFRKKRSILSLKKTGQTPKRGTKRRNQKSRYR